MNRWLTAFPTGGGFARSCERRGRACSESSFHCATRRSTDVSPKTGGKRPVYQHVVRMLAQTTSSRRTLVRSPWHQHVHKRVKSRRLDPATGSEVLRYHGLCSLPPEAEVVIWHAPSCAGGAPSAVGGEQPATSPRGDMPADRFSHTVRQRGPHHHAL